MAHVVLFHSVLGLRPVEHKIAAALEEHGHVITLPDLYDGRSATHYDTGFELKDKVGEVAIHERVLSALPAPALQGVTIRQSDPPGHRIERPAQAPGSQRLFAGGCSHERTWLRFP
jgi:dienelactone hydrolase